MPTRKPDLIIGSDEDPYLHRWWVIPRNPVFNIYLHHFMRSDHDVLHDHPWLFNLSWLLPTWVLRLLRLAGCGAAYTERTPTGDRLRSPGNEVLRFGPAPHSVQLTHGDVWTLFITGPKYRVWGFLCSKGWTPFYTFKAYNPAISGQIVDDRGQCP